MNRWIARGLLAGIFLAILTVLLTVSYAPADGCACIISEGGESQKLIWLAADVLIIVAMVAGGLCAVFGLVFAVVYLWGESK